MRLVYCPLVHICEQESINFNLVWKLQTCNQIIIMDLTSVCVLQHKLVHVVHEVAVPD